VDETHVYYYTYGAVSAIPKAGGEPREVYDPKSFLPLFVTWAADDTSLYIGDIGSDRALYRADKSDATEEIVYVNEDDMDIVAVGTDADNVYFIEVDTLSLDPDDIDEPTYFSSVPKAGGAKTRFGSFDPSLSVAQAALASDAIVFSALRADSWISHNYYSMSRQGGDPVLLAEDISNAVFAVADGYVYYPQWSRLMKVPAGGGTPEELPGPMDEGALALATDSSSVYWAEFPGCIIKVPKH
jgi:hypothetical protein